MVILRSQNKITDFFMILAWASPFKKKYLSLLFIVNSLSASLLLNIFLSFEVGIAHAIANFK